MSANDTENGIAAAPRPLVIGLKRLNFTTDHRAPRTNDSGLCLTCGQTHPACGTPACDNPTHCPPGSPGLPFLYCDPCERFYARLPIGHQHAADTRARWDHAASTTAAAEAGGPGRLEATSTEGGLTK